MTARLINTHTIENGLENTDIGVRVMHQENGGVSSAHNLGNDNARSRYIAFIDGDDIVAST